MSLLKDIVKLVERGLHEKTTSFTGAYNDTDVFKIARRKNNKKKQVNYVVTEDNNLQFGVYSRPHFDEKSVKLKVMSNHPHDDYYDSYDGITVVFNNDGSVDYQTNDKNAEVELSKFKDRITKVAREYLGDYVSEESDESHFNTYLKEISRGNNYWVRVLVCKDKVHIFYHTDSYKQGSAPAVIVPYSNHRRIIRLALALIKGDQGIIARGLIRQVKEDGYNYPEFKKIEKYI